MVEQDNKEAKRTITGKVVSNSMDKTITVVIERKLKHPLYNKYIFKTSKIMAHDEKMVILKWVILLL